jgi:glyoxylase-like metal-dependent hydrolase (beta-lactamase superfamily II)
MTNSNTTGPRTQAVSRRTAFKAALAAGATLAMPQIMVRPAFANAPMQDGSVAEFFRFKLGDFEITTLRDGVRAADGPHPTFGANQPPETVHALLRENNLPETRFANGFTPTLVNTGSELILFDTGLGAGARENGLGKTAAALKTAGYSPEQVNVVVLTHFHPDHFGGLMENGAPAFANARYVMGETEFNFWTAPERMSGPTEKLAKTIEGMIKPLAEKATFIKDGGAVVSGITGMAAPGHTPGHMIFSIESGGKRVVLTADTANHFVVSLQRPDWEVAFDADKAVAAQTRKQVFDMIAADKLPFIGYHMPWPSVGFVEKMGEGYRYIPNSYQVEL